ncbi:MAG: prefoldin subunit alpha [Candidatus Aenigmatarchaeota archaeon]
MEETKKEEIAQKIYYYKIIEENFQILTNLIKERENKLIVIRNAINALKKIEENECLIPITDNLLIKATILDKEKFLVNVGHNIFLEKNLKQTIEFLENLDKEINENIQKLRIEANQLFTILKSLELEIQKMSEEKVK